MESCDFLVLDSTYITISGKNTLLQIKGDSIFTMRTKHYGWTSNLVW